MFSLPLLFPTKGKAVVITSLPAPDYLDMAYEREQGMYMYM